MRRSRTGARDGVVSNPDNRTATTMNFVNVVGSGIHIFKSTQGNATATVEQLVRLARRVDRLILVSTPKYGVVKEPPLVRHSNESDGGDLSNIPKIYRKSNLLSENIYWDMIGLPVLKRQHHGLPHSPPNTADAAMYSTAGPVFRFLDVFQLTGTCYMSSCSVDAAHRTRFVNRWKAQLLLNMICTYDNHRHQ